VSRRTGLLGLGAALVAAGAGTAIGLAAERWTVRRTTSGETDPGLGALTGDVWPVVTADGTKLHVEVDELPDGADVPLTVVFSHGYCLSRQSWHFQRQALRGRYRMVFWDQRGHGLSDAGPKGSCTVDQCGHDLQTVLAAVAPTGPVALVGHSMGGMTIMALALHAPELVRSRVVGVALVATSAGGLANVHWGLRGQLGAVAHKVVPAAVAGLARVPALVNRSRRIGSDFQQVMVARYSFASRVPESLARFTAEMIASTPIDVVAEYLPTFDLHDKHEALAALDGIDTLVLSGADDLLTPPEHSEEIVRRLPGADQVLVPDAGHLVMLEHPDLVTEAIGDLLERAERAVRGMGTGKRARRRRSA
jgi:pimeloyl-ACP methyl ester carboxylesterase